MQVSLRNEAWRLGAWLSRCQCQLTVPAGTAVLTDCNGVWLSDYLVRATDGIQFYFCHIGLMISESVAVMVHPAAGRIGECQWTGLDPRSR